MKKLGVVAFLAMGCSDKDSEVEPVDDTGTVEQTVDADSDGYTSDEDCNDSDATISPSALELCDGVDNNCDGQIDEGVTGEWFQDLDGDGFGNPDVVEDACSSPDGYVAFGSDCDDTEAEAWPGNTEVCDAIDNDCNGEVDEGLAQIWYVDADNDGFGLESEIVEACEMPEGTSDLAGDCDDSEAAISPVAAEICDGIDNDCDGVIDGEGALGGDTWYADSDGDGFGDPASPSDSCEASTGYVTDDTDCDDSNADIHPDAEEICDEIDNDCNGWTDDDDPGVSDGSTWYFDYDGDGYGAIDYSIIACQAPSDYIADGTDCDDLDATAYPGGTEVCDDADNDCDGLVDTDDSDLTDAGTYYADSDGDGFGDATSSVQSCEAATGYVTDDTDCDDSSADIHPDEDEICDELDNDCNGLVDDDDSGLTDAPTWYIDTDEDGYGTSDATAESCEAPSGYVDNDDDCDDSDGTRTDDCSGAEEEEEEEEEETDWGEYSEEECDGVDTESLVIFSNDDADIFCGCGNVTVDNVYINSTSSDPVDLSCIEAVEGYLEIENSISSSIDLSNVVEIGDELYIHDNDDLESIDLSALEVIGDYFYLYENNSLESVDLSSLTEVGNYFYVYNHDYLEQITLDSLQVIDGDFYLYQNDSYADFEAPLLEEVNGSFQIYGHWSYGIETLYLPSLTSISSSLSIEYNYDLQEIDLSSLTEVGGQVYLYYNPDLDTLYLNSLQDVGSSFYLYQTSYLETLELDSLTEIGGSMYIQYNSNLESLYAPVLEDLGDSLYIQENASLSSVDLSLLCGINDFTIEGNDLTEDDQYDLLVQLSGC